MRKFTLGRDERLRGNIAVSRLFRAPIHSVSAYPFRVHWSPSAAADTGIRVLFVASSRRYRKAVTRNRIKRVLRELYRLNKAPLNEQLPAGMGLDIALMYSGPDSIAYHELLPRFEKLISKMCIDVQTHCNP
jgi:ribonuclease P protein component